ncbi:MAG: hypothetical protein LC624_01610 [Halobacteriales archaeon]|nr:hypothetical protein [Halobacteriales archaeon]
MQLARQVALAVLLLAAVAWALPSQLPWAALGVLAWFAATRLRRKPAPLIGRVVEARSDLAPRGEVLVDGAVWAAIAEEPVRAGERVRVLAQDEGVLRVVPVGVYAPEAERRKP